MDKINSTAVLPIKEKAIQVYDSLGQKMYSYADNSVNDIQINKEALVGWQARNSIYFTQGRKEAVAYKDDYGSKQLIIIAAGFDEKGKKDLQRRKLILIVGYLGSILIVFASSYFCLKLLMRPIRKIADEVNIISAQSLAHRIKSTNASAEWNYLTQTLNDLLNRLQESFEIQRRFISSASHELSTPLTSISSQLEVSLQRDRQPEDYRQVMRSVYQDVRHLSKLTQTLLEFATVAGTAGGIEINLVRIDEVLMRIPGEITKLGRGFSVHLEFDELPEDEEKLLVFGNSELLFTAIKNLVSNACKYSLNHLASMRLSVNQKDIVVSVEDNGKGISEDELKNIFQPFYRTEDSRTIAGFGVGLPLVNRIIKLHKGQINVTSIVGKGTRFVVQLPIAGNAKSK
jgi:signal transduction histidine kinase